MSLRTESLVRLTWPILLQNTTNSLVMFVDFLFFSYLSDEIAGTVGQLLPIFWMGAFVIPVFAGTGVSVASQYLGAKRDEKVVPTYMMNLFLSGGLGGIYALLLGILSSQIGKWMGMDAVMNSVGTEYLSTICFYFLFMGVMVAYNAILSSRGMTHWLMYTSFAVAGVNLILNSVFVFVFEWGVQGIAFASVCGAFVSMLLGLYFVHCRLGIRFYVKGAWEHMLGVLKPMMRIGIPNALEPFSYSVQQTILSTFIISLGMVSMAANNYAGRLQMFHITFGFSLAQSAQILLAHWMGSKRFDDVHRIFWKTINASMGFAFLSCLLIWWQGTFFLGFFTDDPRIIEMAKRLLMISVFLEPARAVNIVGGFSLRTVGDARFPLLVGMAFIWGILPVIFVIDHFWSFTLFGLWMCFAIDEIVRAGINIWRWQTGKWRSMGFAHD